MSGNHPTMPWDYPKSDGSAKCSACRKTIPKGQRMAVRHAERLWGLPSYREAYPKDPTPFCMPCVTPREQTPAERLVHDWSRSGAAWPLIVENLFAWDEPLADLARRVEAAMRKRAR